MEKFARGTEVSIKEWIVQMETYFDISSLKPKFYVGFMLQKIAHPYFKEAVVYKDLRYLNFCEKLIEVFGELDMATARLQDLSRASQEVGELISDYMNRIQLLVMRAHPDLSHKERERILVSNFQLGLPDQELATSLAIATISTSAEAERKATKGKSAKNNARIKKSYSNYMSTNNPDEQFEGAAAGYESIFYDSGQEVIAGSFNDRRGYCSNASSGRPGRGFGGRCRGYSGTGTSASGESWCFQSGHFGHIRINLAAANDVCCALNKTDGVVDLLWSPLFEAVPEVRRHAAMGCELHSNQNFSGRESAECGIKTASAPPRNLAHRIRRLNHRSSLRPRL